MTFLRHGFQKLLSDRLHTYTQTTDSQIGPTRRCGWSTDISISNQTKHLLAAVNHLKSSIILVDSVSELDVLSSVKQSSDARLVFQTDVITDE